MDEQRTFDLSPESIDAASDYLTETLTSMRVSKRNLVLVRLSVEEAMLRLRDHLGDDSQIDLGIRSSLGGSYVWLDHMGAPFNPLGDENEGALGGILFNAVGVQPHYVYTGTKNVLRVPFPRTKVNPALALLAGITLGVLLGVLGNVFLPWQSEDIVAEYVLEPLFEIWTRTLNAIAAPVIFFTVIATMLDMRKVDARGGSHKRVVGRYFILNFIVGFVAVFVSVLVFLPELADDIWGARNVFGILKELAKFVPEHVVDPFITSNTPQLLLVAFIIGNAVIVLRERAREVARLVGQINAVNTLVTQWVSMLVPLFSGIMVALEIWNNQLDVLPHIWRPLVLGGLVSTAFYAVELGNVCARLKVHVLTLARKLHKPYMVAVRAGTLEAAYGEAEHSCSYDLGIDQTFTGVTLPLGLVLYMPSSIIGTLIFTVFAADVYGTQVNATWLVVAVVLDVLLFVATPPVPGANLLAFIALFHQLGIPRDVFLDAMIFDILYGLFANAANQSLLQIELIRQADHIGLLNRERLRRPLK